MVHIDSVNGRALVILLVVGGIMSTGLVAAASVQVDSDVPFQTNSGLTVTTGTSISQDLTTPFLSNNAVELQNVTFESSTGGELTVDQYTGTYTNLSSIDANGHTIIIAPPQKSNVSVSGGVTALDFADATVGDGETDFVYSASSAGTVRVFGLSPGAKIGARDASGSPVDGGTVAANGSVAIDVGSATDRAVELFADPAEPEIDESTASPTTKTDLDASVDLSVDIRQAEFPKDNVTAEFYLDGSLVGTDTLDKAGEAQVTTSVTTGGQHEWRVVATSAYNQVDKSDASPTQSGLQNFTFSLPATLSIRNETNTSELVDGGSVGVTFIGSNDVVQRTDSNADGNISFDGLPLDQQFEAEITANGYEKRSVVIPSLFRQQNAYMLPDNATSVQPRFVIDSAVSEFPERDSTIIIERPINRSGSLQFATITSAKPGVSGLDVTLKKDQRYRLTVKSPGGATRQLGNYQATATEKVVLEIASGDFKVPDDVQGVSFDAGFTQPATVTATVRDENIQSASVTVTRRNDSTVILSQTATGNLSVSTPAKNETQYVVNMTATLQSGKTVSDTQQVSSGKIATGSAIDSKWQQLLAMALLLIVAGLFTRANAGVGAISTASIGGVFWYIGWLNGLATGLAVVVALLIGILAYAKQKRGGVPT